MSAANNESEKVFRAKLVRKFCKDLFVYLRLTIEEMNPEITSSNGEDKITESIGKAVRVADFILHHYTDFFYRNVTFPQTFKSDVERVLSDWLINRTNIFVKVIDTAAFIFEAYMYSLIANKSKMNFNEATEWFFQVFQRNFTNEFYINGGWKKLHQFSRDKYTLLYNNFKNITDTDMFEHTFYMLQIQSDKKCELMKSARVSYVSYPIPQSFTCFKCQSIFDDDYHHKIVYIMEVEEYEERQEELVSNTTAHNTVCIMEVGEDERKRELLIDDYVHSGEISSINDINGDCNVKAFSNKHSSHTEPSSREIHEKDLPNNLFIENRSAVASDSQLVDIFMQELKQKINSDMPLTEKEFNQTKLHLISKNFSNSFGILLKKIYLDYVDEEKLRDLTYLKENLQMIVRSGERISETDNTLRFSFSRMKFMMHWAFDIYFLGKHDEIM